MATSRQNDRRTSLGSAPRRHQGDNDDDNFAALPINPMELNHQSATHDDVSSSPIRDGIRRISHVISPLPPPPAEYSRLDDHAIASKDVERQGSTDGDEYEDDDDDVDLEDLDGDSLDEDVADIEDHYAKRTDSFCGEARLNCTRFTTQMRKDGRRIRKCCRAINYKNFLHQYCSMETLKRRLPILQWAPKYRLSDLQGDLVAGTTVGLTVIPQAIAYTALAGVRSEFGLYSAYISSIVYTFLGSSKDITSGPSAISSLMAGIYCASPITKDATVAIVASFLCGFIYIGMAMLNLGVIIMDFVSLSIIKAFMVASAVTIAMSQVKRWWGQTGVPNDFLSQLYWTVNKIPQSRLYDFLLGVGCIFLIVLLKKLKEIKWKRRFRDLPIHLKILNKTIFYLGLGRNIVTIIVATIIAYVCYLNGLMPFNLTGSMPPGIPPWQIPNMTLHNPADNKTYTLTDFSNIIGIGFLLIPLLGLLEAMAIGSVFARRFNYIIDVNQELLAIGVGNVLTGLASGFPVTGTFSRTAVNAQSGVKTPAGGLVTGAIVLIAIQFATPVFFYIPHCSLATVIMMAVIDMITFQKLWIFWKTKPIDLIPWIVTFVLSFCISIAWGVIIGIGVSIILLLYPSARPKIKVVRQDATEIIGPHQLLQANSTVAVVNFDSGLLYAAMGHVRNKVISLYTTDDLPRGIVYDFKHVPSVDTTTVQGMRLTLEACHKKGIPLVVCNLKKPVEKVFTKAKMKFYLQAVNVEDAVKLIFGIKRKPQPIAANGARSKHGKPSLNNNNMIGYDNPACDVIDDASDKDLSSSASSSSIGKQTTGDVKNPDTVVDSKAIKKLVQEEVEKIMREGGSIQKQPSPDGDSTV